MKVSGIVIRVFLFFIKLFLFLLKKFFNLFNILLKSNATLSSLAFTILELII